MPQVFSRNMHGLIFENKKGKTVHNALIEIVYESCKPNKFLIDQGRELYNKFMQEWLDNNVLMTLQIIKESQ